MPSTTISPVPMRRCSWLGGVDYSATLPAALPASSPHPPPPSSPTRALDILGLPTTHHTSARPTTPGWPRPRWSTRKARQNSVAGPLSTSLDTVLSLTPQQPRADVDIDVLEVRDSCLPTTQRHCPPCLQRAQRPCTHRAAFNGHGDFDSKCNAVDAYAYSPAPRSLHLDSVKTVFCASCAHTTSLSVSTPPSAVYVLDALDGFRIASLAADAVPPVKNGSNIPQANDLASPLLLATSNSPPPSSMTSNDVTALARDTQKQVFQLRSITWHPPLLPATSNSPPPSLMASNDPNLSGGAM
ncbi:hypothetical protein C8R46DRAFT_1277517 [Mycena filopes]|nr:hypothetical protein C8R46DRAFT_1277517 [Mycena filopes]